MPFYAVYLHVDLLETLPSSGRQRRKIIEFVRTLQAQPGILGDYTEQDGSYRQMRIKIVGKFAVTYCLDDPAQAVVIYKLQAVS